MVQAARTAACGGSAGTECVERFDLQPAHAMIDFITCFRLQKGSSSRSVHAVKPGKACRYHVCAVTCMDTFASNAGASGGADAGFITVVLTGLVAMQQCRHNLSPELRRRSYVAVVWRSQATLRPLIHLGYFAEALLFTSASTPGADWRIPNTCAACDWRCCGAGGAEADMEELSDSEGGPEEPLDHFAEAVERSAKDAERLMESVVKARLHL